MPFPFEPNKERRPIKENDLVSEQPGFFILFLGVFFSVVVGLSIKTAAQSNWFHMRLKEAIANVGTDWRIQHGEVGLYFKDGIKPSIGLYVDEVRIASESSCYMKSGGFAQRVKIPLSLIKYILDGQLVSEIEVQDLKIEITEKTPVCHGPSLMTDESKTVNIKKKNQITIVDRVQRSGLKNEIERVRINRLEIFYPDEKYSYLQLKNIVVENRSVHPKILFMEGDVDLSPFIRAGDGQKSANLKIEYNEFPEKIIKSNLLGSLREGFFSIQVVNRIDDKKFQLQSELKNVSLSLLKGFVPDIPKAINLKSNWLSTKIYIEGVMDSMTSSTAEVKDIVVNGDFGEFVVDDLIFSHGFNGKPSPFVVNLKSIDISKLLKLNPDGDVPDQINSLGIFEGTVSVDDDRARMNGQVSDLGIVFSAGGVRKIESLSVGKVQGEFKKNHISIEAQEIRNSVGIVNGFVKLKSEDLKHFEIEASLKNIHFSEDVAELMTRADAPFVVDDFSFKASGAKDKFSYRTTGKIQTLHHEFFEANNLSFVVIGDSSQFQDVEIKVERWQSREKFQKKLTDLGLILPGFVAKPRLKLAEHGDEIQLKIDAPTPIRISAVLSKNDQLTGSVSLKDQEWKVNGTRNNFQFIKK